MASARFPGRRRPAARGMKRSLPYVMRQHSWGHLGAADRTARPALNRSDHHRYGEVKTRLTIDLSTAIQTPVSAKRKGLQLALEPLNGRGIAGYVPKP